MCKIFKKVIGMDKESEELLKEKAAEWAKSLIEYNHKKGYVLGARGLQYVLEKAFKCGYNYAKNHKSIEDDRQRT
jgi:hypothetical protein